MNEKLCYYIRSNEQEYLFAQLNNSEPWNLLKLKTHRNGQLVPNDDSSQIITKKDVAWACPSVTNGDI